MEHLQGWYLGFGEVETIRRMSPIARQFLADAAEEDPDFIGEYLLPILEHNPDPEGQILSDLADAVTAYELYEHGLGEFDENLGNLGKSFFKKVGQTIKKVAKTVSKPIIDVHKKAFEAAKKVETKVVKAVEKTAQKAGKAVSKAWQKYGSIFITVLGAVLAPFTGGASLAAAALITAGNTLYQKKRAADQAKRMAKANAGQLAQEAAAAEADTMRQVDEFYSQNQQWFIDNLDVTPDKWAQLTLQQKIDLINAGATGRPPSGTPQEPPAVSPPSSFPPPGSMPQPMPGGGSSAGGGAGGGGGGGLYPDGSSPSGGFSPYQPQTAQKQQVQEAGMFGSAALPVLAIGAVLALAFGKPVKGRKTRRNPGRRRRRAA